MKFGKRLEDDLQEVGWEQHYLRYNDMKMYIKEISEAHPLSHHEVRVSSTQTSPDTGVDESTCSISAPRCRECTAAGHELLNKLKTEAFRIREFVQSCIVSREELFEETIQQGVEQLLKGVKKDYNATELLPNHPKVLQVLASLAVWIDDLGALRQFVLVNLEAQRKIVKKFSKWCRTASDVQHVLSENTIVSSDEFTENLKSRPPKSSSELSLSRRHRTTNTNTVKDDFCTLVEERIGFDSQAMLDEIGHLRQRAMVLETKILVTRSAYHDFLQDHRMLLRLENQHKKISRVEASSSRLLRHTIAMEENNHPAMFLIAAVVIPLITLFVTYTLSGSIYVDEEESISILEEKGFFISASIDRAPASNVGTLGLTTALMLLAVTMFLKHKIIKKKLRGRMWAVTRRVSLFIGLTCVFCGNGVAAFQHQDHAFAHNMFAAGFFVTGMVHVFLETSMEWANELSSPFARKLRVLLASCLILSVIGFLTPMSYIVSGACAQNDCPERKLKDFAALCEVTAFTLLILWFGSYYWMIRNSSFDFQVLQTVPLSRELYLRSKSSTQSVLDLHGQDIERRNDDHETLNPKP